jgi:hypothetical protein
MRVGDRIGIEGHHQEDGTNEVVVIARLGPEGVVLTCPIHGGEWNLVQEDREGQGKLDALASGMVALKSTPRCPQCAKGGTP